ncbi:MAG TPA: hypothetical protein VL240_09695 [Candidatus Binatia bacterium]|nr:hypothetical protein [Candidatus Binatia bacterium]
MKIPGYNSPQRMTFPNWLLSWTLALFCISSAHALNDWDSASADLARQIAALSGPGTITLVISNRSSVANDDVPAIRRALERELRSAGVVVRQKDADSEVRVTLSQNMQGWLWVAEVQEGSETKVTMLPLPGATVSGTTTSAPAIALQANLLHAQSEPILDVAVLGSAAEQHMIVLDPQHIRSYTLQGGSWQPAQSYDIPAARPFPRDVRGRIVPAADHLFDAYLPGLVCTAARPGESWTMNITCIDSDDPWPLGSQKAFYNAGRDFFTGVVLPGFGPRLSPFYSAAELAGRSSTAFLFADVNAQVHILEGSSHRLVVGARDWGSDIAAARSQCGSGTQVLASAAGWPATDSLRAYEISGREATPVSAPLSFDGTITALWPASNAASVIAVVRKPQGLRYEAYSVTVACSH